MAGGGAVSPDAGDVGQPRSDGGRRRTLVAGIGNIFFGDDGFGVEVARRLGREPLGDGVDVKDFGIRGVHLAYEIAGGAYERVVLVDAAPRGGPPGTVYAIEPTLDATDATGDAPGPDGHSLTPALVLSWLQRIGGDLPRITVVGCEPGCVEESMELSGPVSAAIDTAVQLVQELVARSPER